MSRERRAARGGRKKGRTEPLQEEPPEAASEAPRAEGSTAGQGEGEGSWVTTPCRKRGREPGGRERRRSRGARAAKERGTDRWQKERPSARVDRRMPRVDRPRLVSVDVMLHVPQLLPKAVLARRAAAVMIPDRV